MVTYRFLDAMGDELTRRDFDAHADALAWAVDGEELDDLPGEVQRVEFLGPDGDWRWAGALQA